MYSAERHFVTTAHTQLGLMASEQVEETLVFDRAIEKIKQAAAPVNARAVYRAALLCEDVLGRYGSVTDNKFQTAFTRLKSLIELYANGLFEIDPEFKPILNGEATQAVLNPVEAITPYQSEEISPKQNKEQLIAANQNAAEVLKPLLRLVKKDTSKDALSFLADFGPQSDVEPETENPKIKLDRFMGQITNHILGEARAKGKNVSISYAADFETIDASIAPDIQKLLQNLCLDIVRNGLTITGDLAASMTQNWQISITGEAADKPGGSELTFSLNWRGQTLSGLSNLVQNPEVQITQNTDPKNAGLDEQVLTLIYPVKKIQSLTTAGLPKQAVQANVREA